MKPTEYYYAFKKIHSKYPIAGTVVHREMEKIRKHENRLVKTENIDQAQKNARRETLQSSVYVAKKLVNIQAETMRSVTAVKKLDEVVAEKSERLTRLRYGPSASNNNNNNNTNIGDLFDFVKEGNHDMVKRFLLSAPETFTGINAGKGSIGNTPLHIAVGKGDVTMLKVLLKFGGDPNIRNKLGKVPLHIVWSCWLTAPFFNKNVKKVEAETCIEFLLQYGADPTIHILHNLETPLHTAARLGNAKIVTRLLSFGAKPLIENSNGDTPLDLAAASKHLEAVRIMANWPSVLKFLRTNEVRAKWSKFLEIETSSLAKTSTAGTILLDEKTKVQHQVATSRQTKGAVRISNETYLLFDKEGGSAPNISLTKGRITPESAEKHKEHKRIWEEKKKRAAAERKRKATLKKQENGDNRIGDAAKQSLYRNQYGVGNRPSAMLFKKKSDVYSGKRFEVKRSINFNSKTKSLRTRRLESAEATISDTYLSDGSRPASLSPIGKSSRIHENMSSSKNYEKTKSYQASNVKHNGDGDNKANGTDTPSFVTYNDPRSLPPKKSSVSPEVLPKSNSIEYKNMAYRKKIAGVKRIDRQRTAIKKNGKQKNIDPWVPAKSKELIDRDLSFSESVQI